MFTHSRANLALTLTKLVLKTKDLIFMLLDGLEVFLGVGMTSSNSSKLKMTGVRRIYKSSSLVAVAPTVRRKNNIPSDEPMPLHGVTSVHPVTIRPEVAVELLTHYLRNHQFNR